MAPKKNLDQTRTTSFAGRKHVLLFFLTATNLAFSVIFFSSPFVKAAQCRSLFSNSLAHLSQTHWLSRANPQTVKAYILENGRSLSAAANFQRNGFSSDAFVITDYFFEKANLPVPAAAHPIQLNTYQYYDPNKDDYNFIKLSSRLKRGGGRDHSLPLAAASPRVEFDPSVTEKGSGPNAFYSSVNGSFDAKDFRTNGLQTDAEVVSERIVIEQLQMGGVPVVDHPQTRLAPPQFQKLIGALDTDGKMLGPLAAQSTRRQSSPRDSFRGVENVTAEKRFELISQLLINNVGHGGINPENMADGKLSDPGHVTIGYPILSGAYRCVVCKSINGSRFDGTMVGILDYFFPGKTIDSYDDYFGRRQRGLPSTKFKITKEDQRSIAKEISLRLYGNDQNFKMSAPALAAFEKLLKQKIEFETYINNDYKVYYEIAERLLNRKNTDRDVFFWGADNAVSARFLMQLGALRGVSNNLQKSAVNKFIQRWRDRITKTQAESFSLLIEHYEAEFLRSPMKEIVLEKLFSEHLPVNMILQDIEKRREQNPDFETWYLNLKKIMKDDAQPVKWKPLEWMNAIQSVLDENAEP